jgi:hypothetical protein
MCNMTIAQLKLSACDTPDKPLISMAFSGQSGYAIRFHSSPQPDFSALFGCDFRRITPRFALIVAISHRHTR